jgi:hypothetical protein
VAAIGAGAEMESLQSWISRLNSRIKGLYLIDRFLTGEFITPTVPGQPAVSAGSADGQRRAR